MGHRLRLRSLLSMISVCESGRAFFASSIHSTILFDGHHGNRLRLFVSSGSSTGVVFAVSCGKFCVWLFDAGGSVGCVVVCGLFLQWPLPLVFMLPCISSSIAVSLSLLLLQCCYLLYLCSRSYHHVLHLGSLSRPVVRYHPRNTLSCR